MRDILSLAPLKERARRLRINLGIASNTKSLTIEEVVEKLRREKMITTKDLDSATIRIAGDDSFTTDSIKIIRHS